MSGISTSFNSITIDSLDDVSLDNVDLVIYGACLTGKDGNTATNLVTATHNRGARTVIGFKLSISASVCEEWYKKFFELFSENYDDSTYTYHDLCMDTYDSLVFDEDSDLDANELLKFVEFTIAGEQTLPNN